MPTVSASWKASLPIMWVATWPVRQTMGTESMSASVSAGDGIGGAGAGGDQDAADLAGRAGIAFGGVHRRLLVADEDVADAVLLEDGIVERQHGAAGIAEDDLYALLDQRLEHHLRAVHRRSVDGGRRGCRCGHESNSGLIERRVFYRRFFGDD